MNRWNLLTRAVKSLQVQSAAVDTVVVCIDNNEELLSRAQEEWSGSKDPVVTVIANRHSDHLARISAHQAAHGTNRRFGAGSARNTAAESISADIIAFMDDDARADPDWIEELLKVFERSGVVAVGGPPVPDYETARPGWYPGNFDWVFGCVYDGLPTTISPLRHLIGANMAVRRSAFEAVGGFVGSDFDDLNLCMRLTENFGDEGVFYTPLAIVHHFVTGERVTWRYFWRRCYFVNREKVRVFRRMGSAANLKAERAFVIHAVQTQFRRTMSQLSSGDTSSLAQLGAMLAGIALAGLGHVRGQIDQLTLRSRFWAVARR